MDEDSYPLAATAAVFTARAKRWSGILATYFSAQALTQLLGLCAGLVLVRYLPVREFALYTLATSVLTFFAFVTDLGMTGSLSYFYRRSAQQGTDFAPYMHAVLVLRRFAFTLGAVTVAAVLPFSAREQGFSPAAASLATVAVLVGVWFQIESGVAVHVLRLRERFNPAYRAEIAGGALRLAGSVAMVMGRLLFGWLGVLVSAAASALTARTAKASTPVPGSASWRDTALPRRQVLRFLLPTLPSALYFSLQSPLIVWLAATFGNTENIAQVGALGRLGLLVGMFSNLTGIVFVPRLAQIHDDRLYRRRFLQFAGLLAVIAGVMILLARLAPQALLWLLGAAYSGLSRELLIIVGTASLNLLGGFCVTVNMARSWNRWQTLSVVLLAVSQALLAALLPLSTTAGVLLLGFFTSLTGLLLQLATSALGFVAPRLVHWD